MRKLFVLVVALTASVACGSKHPGSYDAGPAATPAAAPAGKVEEADALWAQRIDGAKLEAALVAYEAALAEKPGDRHVLGRLTRGWYFYGDAYSDDNEVKLERWGKAIAWGTQCLSANPEFAKRLAEGAKEKEAIAAATKDDVPCIYWTSSALGKWAKMKGLATTLRHIDTVKAYMAKVEELDASFFYFGPGRYWGAYYSATPVGKDLTKSGDYLAASLTGAPNYLGTRVIRAEYLAVAKQDPKLFTEDLEAVIAADPTVDPEIVAENTREQDKAKKLLARKKDLFANLE